MIVVDACAAIEVLIRSELGIRIEQRLFSSDELLNAPHLLDLEVLQVFRNLVLAKDLTAPAALEKLDRLQQMDLVRQSHHDLNQRIFQLRHNLTAYDACYLALAEHIGATLVTSDRVFDRVPGHRVPVEVWQ